MPSVEVVFWEATGRHPPAYSVRGMERKTQKEGDTSWVMRRWDKTDQEYFWWCVACRSAGCECVQTVKMVEHARAIADGDPGDVDNQQTDT